MNDIGVTEAEGMTTLNERHQGLVDREITRIVAARWFTDERIVMIDGGVTKKKTERIGSNFRTRFDEVRASIVLELRPTLPGGQIDRQMEMEHILAVIAVSFGVLVTVSPGVPPSTFYSGPWNGEPIAISSEQDRTYVVSGSYGPRKKTCAMVYALGVERYREWFNRIKS